MAIKRHGNGFKLTGADANAFLEHARQAPGKMIPRHCLEVGLSTDERDVIVNHPDLTPSPGGRGGHIVFSPQQARDLAALLLRKAAECKP